MASEETWNGGGAIYDQLANALREGAESSEPLIGTSHSARGVSIVTVDVWLRRASRIRYSVGLGRVSRLRCGTLALSVVS